MSIILKLDTGPVALRPCSKVVFVFAHLSLPSQGSPPSIPRLLTSLYISPHIILNLGLLFFFDDPLANLIRCRFRLHQSGFLWAPKDQSLAVESQEDIHRMRDSMIDLDTATWLGVAFDQAQCSLLLCREFHGRAALSSY